MPSDAVAFQPDEFEGRTREELSDRIRELQDELNRIEEIAEARSLRRTKLAEFVVRLVTGREMRPALVSWLDARERTGDAFPRDETVDVTAAVLRRFVRVSLIGLFIALIPVTIAMVQSYLMWRGNKIFREEALISRRAQLIATIYDTDCRSPDSFNHTEYLDDYRDTAFEASQSLRESPRKGCPAKANMRSRVEALKAFIALERIERRRPDLKFVDLRDADLGGLDLEGVDFEWADLESANLEGARLRRTVLARSNLMDAHLGEADLRDADLWGADMAGAMLGGANLLGASLATSHLVGTFGNEDTKLPPTVERPEPWSWPEEIH